GTVESAICLARQELGEDAMLVNSRKSTPETRHLGAYEVVFASAAEPARARLAPVPAPVLGEDAAAPAAQSLLQEVWEMRRQLAKVPAQVSASRARRRSSPNCRPALDDFDDLLAAQDIAPELAASLLRDLEALPPIAGHAQIQDALRAGLESRFAVSPELSPWTAETPSAPTRTIAALVGPPGAGKTMMAARLAAHYA